MSVSNVVILLIVVFYITLHLLYFLYSFFLYFLFQLNGFVQNQFMLCSFQRNMFRFGIKI